jgi:hypothetical protein
LFHVLPCGAWLCLIRRCRREQNCDHTVVTKVLKSDRSYVESCQSMKTKGLWRLATQWMDDPLQSLRVTLQLELKKAISIISGHGCFRSGHVRTDIDAGA